MFWECKVPYPIAISSFMRRKRKLKNNFSKYLCDLSETWCIFSVKVPVFFTKFCCCNFLLGWTILLFCVGLCVGNEVVRLYLKSLIYFTCKAEAYGIALEMPGLWYGERGFRSTPEKNGLLQEGMKKNSYFHSPQTLSVISETISTEKADLAKSTQSRGTRLSAAGILINHHRRQHRGLPQKWRIGLVGKKYNLEPRKRQTLRTSFDLSSEPSAKTAQIALNTSSEENVDNDSEILEWESKLDHNNISWTH